MAADRRFDDEVLTRRKILFFATAAPLSAAKSNPEAEDQIVSFNEHWGKFFREYFGCPKQARDFEECKPTLGIWDYPEFMKAAKAGRELFDISKK